MRTTAQRNSVTAPALIPKKRCAVYTRKSSEEGLEQEYNSRNRSGSIGSGTSSLTTTGDDHRCVAGDSSDEGARSTE